MRNEKLNLFNIFLLVIAFSQLYVLHTLNIYRTPVHIEAVLIDHLIPLIPFSAIIYLSVYLLLILTVVFAFMKVDNIKFAVFLFAVITVYSISNLIYSLFPTLNIIRPEQFDAGFLTGIVSFLYNLIPPYNTFPGFASVTAVLCSFLFFRVGTRFNYLIYIWAVLICISALFSKMNYILDVVGSIPLAISCYLFAEIAYGRFFKVELFKQ